MSLQTSLSMWFKRRREDVDAEEDVTEDQQEAEDVSVSASQSAGSEVSVSLLSSSRQIPGKRAKHPGWAQLFSWVIKR